MSDHEVNIKILLDVLLRDGLLESRKERNEILREMTDEVSELVLLDNEQQALALTLDGLRSAAAYDEYVAFVEELVGGGHHPSRRRRRADARRADGEPGAGRGLPRPLLAVLMGHVKNWAFARVLKTALPDGGRRHSWTATSPRCSAAVRGSSSPPAAPRDHRHRRRQLRDQQGRHPAAGALAGGTDKDIGAVMQAYLDVDAGGRRRPRAGCRRPSRRRPRNTRRCWRSRA